MKPGDASDDPTSEALAHERTAAAAAAWIRRREAGLSAGERRDLLAWLAADAGHARAFRAADVGRDELDWPLHAGFADVVALELDRRRRRRRSRRAAALGFAAALAGLAAGTAWFSSRDRSTDTGTVAVVEPRRQVLPDGSVVELRPGAEIAVEFAAGVRAVSLQRGTAHFEVAPDPQRPFVVRSGTWSVRAVGTAFAVDRATEDLRVYVTHGRVAVAAAAAPPRATQAGGSVAVASRAELAAGDYVQVAQTATSDRAESFVVRPPSEAEFEAVAGWRRPRLDFSGTPLGAVVAAMNRHNGVQFEVADPAVAELRLSGSLRADKVEALVAILEADFPVRADRIGAGRIVLRRR